MNTTFVKTVFLIGILFLLSSCISMMSLPNYSSEMHHSNTNSIDSETNFDVVCDKTIGINQRSFSLQYQNKPYYFDSEDCLNKFQQSPDTYLNKNTNHHKNSSLLYWGLGIASMGVLMFFMIH